MRETKKRPTLAKCCRIVIHTGLLTVALLIGVALIIVWNQFLSADTKNADVVVRFAVIIVLSVLVLYLSIALHTTASDAIKKHFYKDETNKF